MLAPSWLCPASSRRATAHSAIASCWHDRFCGAAARGLFALLVGLLVLLVWRLLLAGVVLVLLLDVMPPLLLLPLL